MRGRRIREFTNEQKSHCLIAGLHCCRSEKEEEFSIRQADRVSLHFVSITYASSVLVGDWLYVIRFGGKCCRLKVTERNLDCNWTGIHSNVRDIPTRSHRFRGNPTNWRHHRPRSEVATVRAGKEGISLRFVYRGRVVHNDQTTNTLSYTQYWIIFEYYVHHFRGISALKVNIVF